MPGLCLLLLVIFSPSPVNAGSVENDSNSVKKFGLPTVSLGPGMLYFLGDVGYSHFNQPLTSKAGFQFEIQKHTNSNLVFSLTLLSGKAFGEEKTSVRQINFISSVFAEGLQLRYDFQSHKRADQVLTPYISVGAEYMSFNSKADLKDANGIAYQYWSDGTIRDIPQSDATASKALIIHRDYNYETDLHDANIDSLGKFRASTIAFPVGVGVKFHMSERCALNFGTTVHFTSTDLIEGVNDKSKGERVGNSNHDKIIFSFVAFRYNFAAPREVPRKKKTQNKEDFKNVDFNALGSEDLDHDGIPDINDDVIDSTANIKVDANGKPVDSDNDGIPDYKDKEPNSAKDALVNEDGVTITEEMIEAKWKTDSLAALPAIVEYLHRTENINNQGPVTTSKTSSKKLPLKFQSVDTDQSGIISPSEIVKEIDQFLDGKSSLNTTQFYELIDYFFSQD